MTGEIPPMSRMKCQHCNQFVHRHHHFCHYCGGRLRSPGESHDGDEDEWKLATKRPVEIEYRGPYEDPKVVETIEGDFEVDEDYIDEHGGFVIIRGVNGEEYPCSLDIFVQTYDGWNDA